MILRGHEALAAALTRIGEPFVGKLAEAQRTVRLRDVDVAERGQLPESK